MCFLKKNKIEEFGLLGPNYKDVRDFQLTELQPESVELPEEFCFKDKMTSIQRQNWGTCYSHSIDAPAEYLNSREYGRQIKLSQKFICYNTKKISGLWNIQGDYLRNACKSVCQFGAPLEEDWPDVRRNSWLEYIKDEPPAEIYKKAEKYKGKTFWAVETILEKLKQACFQNKEPLAIGARWYKNYKPTPDGRMPPPDLSHPVGGHAFTYVGFTRNKQWFRNSWGTNFGLNGYYYIPDEEFGYHQFWNAEVLLDVEIPENLLEGWVATNYLRLASTPKFREKDIVLPTVNLRLRSHPTIYSSIVKLLTPDNKVEIIGEEVIKANNYKWQKVRLINSQEVKHEKRSG